MLSPIKDFLQQKWKRSTTSFKIETEPVLGMKEGEVAVITYTSAADKMKIFSAFILEGLENGDRVKYVYPSEESETVRAKLEEHGIDVKRYKKMVLSF